MAWPWVTKISPITTNSGPIRCCQWQDHPPPFTKEGGKEGFHPPEKEAQKRRSGPEMAQRVLLSVKTERPMG
jgi:hypothetical protein